MLDEAYRRRPCPWCGGLARKWDCGGGTVLVRSPEMIAVAERVITKSRPQWSAGSLVIVVIGALASLFVLRPLVGVAVAGALG